MLIRAGETSFRTALGRDVLFSVGFSIIIPRGNDDGTPVAYAPGSPDLSNP